MALWHALARVDIEMLESCATGLRIRRAAPNRRSGCNALLQPYMFIQLATTLATLTCHRLTAILEECGVRNQLITQVAFTVPGFPLTLLSCLHLHMT